MLALGSAEGFAWAPLPFLPRPLPASNQNSLSSIIPTLAHPLANSNHSRTCAIPRGWGSPSFTFLQFAVSEVEGPALSLPNGSRATLLSPYQLSPAPHQHSPATCPILQPR